MALGKKDNTIFNELFGIGIIYLKGHVHVNIRVPQTSCYVTPNSTFLMTHDDVFLIELVVAKNTFFLLNFLHNSSAVSSRDCLIAWIRS